MLRLLPTFLLAVGIAAAQVTAASPSFSATANGGQNLQPDQVTVQIQISSPLTSTLADITAALQGSGIAPANFTGVGSVQQYTGAAGPPPLTLQWNYQIPVPLSALKDELASLQGVAASLAKPLALSFTLSGPQVSLQQTAQSCAADGLFTSARDKANQMATAANQQAGSVSFLSTSLSTQIGPAAVQPYVAPSCVLTATFGPTPNAPPSVTVVAIRNVSAPPDLVILVAGVATPAGATLSDALATLSGTGITASNLIGVYNGGPSSSQWQFSLSVPFTAMKDTLAAFQKAASNPSVTISVAGAQLSRDSLASFDCSYQSLLADAQAQARRVTAAAGVTLNGLIHASDSTVAAQGDFSGLLSPPVFASAIFAAVPVQAYYAPASCTLVAQYGIGQ